MLVLDKSGDEIRILLRPDERIMVGDVLNIEGIIVQVVDIEYANLPGLVEHFLRKSMISPFITEENVPDDVKGFLDMLADHRVAIAKIRGMHRDGRYSIGLREFNISRSDASINPVKYSELKGMLGLKSKHSSAIGKVSSIDSDEEFEILLDRLGINLITGMKGTGKSYLAKKLLLRLLDHRKILVVFDVNGEYVNLWRDEDGNPNSYASSITILDPLISVPRERALPLRIPLSEVSFDDFAAFTNINPDTQMYNELISIWEDRKPGDLDDLRVIIDEEEDMNKHVKQGLSSRIKTARALNIFGPFDFKSIIKRYERSGGALIVNLRYTNRRQREVLVSFILRYLVELRKGKKIPPLVLYAEEAQLYVTEEMWDDLLTRVRHYGIFPTFVTNDPRTLPDEVFSLCDNIFCFSFQNHEDLTAIGKAKTIDRATLRIIRNLEPRRCVVIGDITKEFPVIIEVLKEENVMMGGETQALFP